MAAGCVVTCSPGSGNSVWSRALSTVGTAAAFLSGSTASELLAAHAGTVEVSWGLPGHTRHGPSRYLLHTPVVPISHFPFLTPYSVRQQAITTYAGPVLEPSIAIPMLPISLLFSKE